MRPQEQRGVHQGHTCQIAADVAAAVVRLGVAARQLASGLCADRVPSRHAGGGRREHRGVQAAIGFFLMLGLDHAWTGFDQSRPHDQMLWAGCCQAWAGFDILRTAVN